jgi:hypothetical protein
MNMRTVNEVTACLVSPSKFHPLTKPRYIFPPEIRTRNIGFAVEDMKRHMTDEGWQLFAGLEHAGYLLAGHNLTIGTTDVEETVECMNPGTIVLQDKREWDLNGRDFREPKARFSNVTALSSRPDIFKLTILKDAHQRPLYHEQSAKEIGCHAWIVYYHPTIVSHVAPYVRIRHLVRTYHSLDALCVPQYNAYRPNGCLLSGAVSNAYPLRQRLARRGQRLRHIDYLPHPGYHRKGSATPAFLQTLSRYKVAICTSSMYGYALRKLIEATACGCKVITDLPTDEVLPLIDGNLYRIPSNSEPGFVDRLAKKLCDDYNPKEQEHYSKLAIDYYDYRSLGIKLTNDIEALRCSY